MCYCVNWLTLLLLLLPQGTHCGDCGNTPSHDTGGGEVTITQSLTYYSGDCTLQPQCKPNKRCKISGTITVKNNSGGVETIQVTKPSGGLETVADGNSINMQVTTAQSETPCGTPYILPIFKADGSPLGEVRFDCSACPLGVE